MPTLDYEAAKAANYTDEEIADFLKKNPQYASNDALRTITQGAAHLGKLGLKTLQQGAYAVPGFVGDVEALGNKYLPSFATQPIGSMVSPGFRSGLNPLVDAALFGTKGVDWSGSGGSPETNQVFPTSHGIEQASGKMGLNLFPSEQPQGTFEKLATAGVKALPMAAATIASGGATLPALAANVGGGIGGEVGAMATPNSPVGPIVGGLTGGLGGAIAASKGATKAIARGLDDRLTGAEGQLAQTEAARLAAENVTLAASETKRLQALASVDALKAARGTSKEIQALHNAAIDQAHSEAIRAADQSVANIASGLGPAKTLQEAGTNLQESARAWMEAMPAKHAAVWDQVDSMVPKGTPIELRGFQSALKDINSDAGGLEQVAALMKPNLPKAVADRLAATTELNKINNQTINWGDVQRLRTTIGDARGNPALVASIGEKNLSKMYATLTEDMRSSIKDPDALAAFDAANKESTRLYSIAEGPLGKVITSQNLAKEIVRPEDAAKGLLGGGKAGATYLEALRGEPEMAQAISNLGAAHLSSNPKAWSGLSPEAQAALVPDANHRALVNGAFAAKGEAEATLKGARDFAKQAFEGRVGLAAGKEQTAVRKAAQDVVDSRKGEMSAKEQELFARQAVKDAEKAQKDNTTAAKKLHQENFIMQLLGGNLTGKMVGTGLNALGVPIHPDMLEAIGTALPLINAGGRAIVRQPSLMAYPALGLAAGTSGR